MWVQRSGHFNLRDPSWRFVPCLVTLCSNTELPHQDEKDYSASVHSLALVSLHLPLFHAPAPSISLNLPSYHCIFKNTSTRKHSILWKGLKSKKNRRKKSSSCTANHHREITYFSPLMMNNAPHTHTHHIQSWHAHFAECIKQYKHLEIWLWVQSQKHLFWCHSEKWNQWEPWQTR